MPGTPSFDSQPDTIQREMDALDQTFSKPIERRPVLDAKALSEMELFGEDDTPPKSEGLFATDDAVTIKSPDGYDLLEEVAKDPPPAECDLAEKPTLESQPEECAIVAQTDVEKTDVEKTDAEKTKPKKTPEQIERHRANSRAWHEKWEKKGIPRSSSSSNGNGEAARGPAVNAPASLSEARDRFVTHWIQNSGMHKSNERRKLAYKAWMESSIRADIVAGRSGIQN